MEKMLIQLKEAAEIKASILKQEAVLWQKIVQALEAYVEHSEKMQSLQRAVPVPHNRRIGSSDYMTTKEAAKYVNISRSMLEHWRMKGDGPRFVKVGGAVRYRTADLDEYLAGRVYKHTSAYA